MEYVWTLKHLDRTNRQRSSKVQIKPPQPQRHVLSIGSNYSATIRIDYHHSCGGRTYLYREFGQATTSEEMTNESSGKIRKGRFGQIALTPPEVIRDTIPGLIAGLQALASKGQAVVYKCVHMVLGEGNFVLVVAESTFGGVPTAMYDLFRIENGKIAEHWDTLEAIPPRDQWKNSNGKF
jgi:hypothetical protein